MEKQFSQMIDDEGNGNRFKLKTTKFALDFSPGSDQSCMLLKAMILTENKEIFRGDLQILVDFKWDQMERQVKFHSLIYFTFALFLTGDQFWTSNMLKVALIIICLVLQTREVLQIY